ncbi:MAG: tetratricopeptide repeat protein [bacterium]
MNRNGVMIAVGLLLILPICSIQANDTDIFKRANELLQTQRYVEALVAYETFIRENPEHHLIPAAKWAMANIYFTINEDYPGATIIYQNIINKHPDTGWEIFSYDRLGMCYEQQQKWSDAARVYESAMGRLAAETHSELAQEWNEVFKTRLLAAYRNMNDHENMIRIYEEALTNYPAGPAAPNDQFNLAQIYHEMDEPKQAAANFAMLVDRYPFSNPARRVQNEYAELLATELDYDWAPFSTFQAAVRSSQTGHYEEALKGFDEVLAKKRNTSMEHAARFQKELVEFRKSGDAEDLRDKLAATRDEYPFGFGGVRAEQFLEVLGRIIDAETAISANPEDIGAYGGMAFAYYQVQAYYPGIETYKKAISIAPDNNGLYNMLGYCYIGLEAYDGAITTFQQLIDVSPEDPNSYDSMAEAHYANGDTAKAIKFYEQSLSVDSSFTNPYYMLGEIHNGLGQTAEARNYLENYLELDPEGFQAQAAQALLSQLDEEQE